MIDLRNVSFAYSGKKALQDVSFYINSGDFVSIIGPNGGGKTTLAKLILGLLQPDAGTVSVLGAPPRDTRNSIGYVPQYSTFDTQFPVSVLDVVLMGMLRRGLGFYTRTERKEASRALDSVELSGFGSSSFAELSGGQRQRVLIARALVGEPKILLLDEPTASIDTSVEDKLKTVLTRLRSYLTVLMITHDLGFVSDQINKIVCVNRTVHIHEAKHITSAMLEELYGTHVHAVDHHTHLEGCCDG